MIFREENLLCHDFQKRLTSLGLLQKYSARSSLNKISKIVIIQRLLSCCTALLLCLVSHYPPTLSLHLFVYFVKLNIGPLDHAAVMDTVSFTRSQTSVQWMSYSRRQPLICHWSVVIAESRSSLSHQHIRPSLITVGQQLNVPQIHFYIGRNETTVTYFLRAVVKHVTSCDSSTLLER